MRMAPAPYFQGQLLSQVRRRCNEATEVKIDQDNRSNETQASKKLGLEGHRKIMRDADGTGNQCLTPNEYVLRK
jgi:hypothetical protein